MRSIGNVGANENPVSVSVYLYAMGATIIRRSNCKLDRYQFFATALAEPGKPYAIGVQ